MTGNEYQKLAARTMNPDMSGSDTMKHALFGMASEVGEVHGVFQKVYQGHDPESKNIKLELGDLLWFIAEFCTVLGWELEEIMQMNVDKLLERYPEGFDEEKSLHRVEGDI